MGGKTLEFVHRHGDHESVISLTDCCIHPRGSCSRPAVCWYSRPRAVPFSYVFWVAADGWPPLAVFGYCNVHNSDLRRYAGTTRDLDHFYCAYSIREAEVMLVMAS